MFHTLTAPRRIASLLLAAVATLIGLTSPMLSVTADAYRLYAPLEAPVPAATPATAPPTPASPPTPATPAPPPGTSQATSTPSAGHQAFITQVGLAARDAELRTGVPASVTVAQAILESGWGQSTLSTQANNYFGVKAGDPSSASVIWLQTTEYDASGQALSVPAPFRTYATLADSLLDHDLLIDTTTRYSSAMAARTDPREFARRLAADGYATDPDYAAKLIALMDQYNLYQFDT